jgi:adenylate cyclase
LLLNILPAEVAEELKAKGSAEAKQFDEVTVLFTDFINFTGESSVLSPEVLVAELNVCFSAFDDIIEKNGLEKIKTIGDAYMAVCGLPASDIAHAEKVVQAALDIRDFMARRKDIERTFDIRIGINSGSVVAGIVGVKKFQYDIWGDTVNTASRTESSGEAGKVNISRTTYELVKDKFACTHRGKIQAKGKGEIDMYFVEGRI